VREVGKMIFQLSYLTYPFNSTIKMQTIYNAIQGKIKKHSLNIIFIIFAQFFCSNFVTII